MIKLEEKYYDYMIENSRLICFLKDGIKGVMVVDSIRFIGGENKVYVYKIFFEEGSEL